MVRAHCCIWWYIVGKVCPPPGKLSLKRLSSKQPRDLDRDTSRLQSLWITVLCVFFHPYLSRSEPLAGALQTDSIRALCRNNCSCGLASTKCAALFNFVILQIRSSHGPGNPGRVPMVLSLLYVQCDSKG
ncbi:uncharacterized protein HMPREF1120_08610, partial [Exophiala dermatitidis NIH/UT8656]